MFLKQERPEMEDIERKNKFGTKGKKASLIFSKSVPVVYD